MSLKRTLRYAIPESICRNNTSLIGDPDFAVNMILLADQWPLFGYFFMNFLNTL